VTVNTKERTFSSVGLDSGPALTGEVVGHGLFRMSSGDVASVRRKPGPVPQGWAPAPASLLRNSDEQTIAGLCAVFTAIDRMGLPREHYEGWGVVAASRFLGRVNLARALEAFLSEGVWGISPHLIPHFALHSASGTISLGLGLHGPNLGVGGGLHAAAEGFLAALTWLSIGSVPGVWLVLSGWSPELVPLRSGAPPAPKDCYALAIALCAAGNLGGRLSARARLGADFKDVAAPIDLVALDETLANRAEPRPKTVATDPLGRLHIDLIDWPTGRE
jgi:hypothetical protein